MQFYTNRSKKNRLTIELYDYFQHNLYICLHSHGMMEHFVRYFLWLINECVQFIWEIVAMELESNKKQTEFIIKVHHRHKSKEEFS